MDNDNPDAEHGAQPPRRQSALTQFLGMQRRAARAALSRTNTQTHHTTAAANATSNALGTGQSQQDLDQVNEENGEDDTDDGDSGAAAARRARAHKLQKQKEAIEKIKTSKVSKKRKAEEGEGDALNDKSSTPHPGQLSNCEICKERFTVTAYSRRGPKGGLLCNPCGQEFSKDDGASQKRKKRGRLAPNQAGRRTVQSRILDGTYDVGAKPLMTLCIETLAKNIDLADNLGDLPPAMIDRIARMLSKSRLLNQDTVNLFIQSHIQVLKVYDAGKLTTDDFFKMLRMMPQLKTLKLRNAIKFKDDVMEYLTARKTELTMFSIHGANLLGDGPWGAFLKRKGVHLEGLQVYYTDNYFGDKTVELLPKTCPNLRRLKICHNQQITDEGIKHIWKIKKLEHLSLQCIKKINTPCYIGILQSVGHQLQTFSIKQAVDVDDGLLQALHEKCTNLSKLRITDTEAMTDAAFVRLFRGWGNIELSFIDLQKCRFVDANESQNNPKMVGLCSEGFKALMKHSGAGLQYLNLHACRHISREAFEKVFSCDMRYEKLRYLEISFIEAVDDLVVGNIFRSCPNIKEINVFGCMKVKDVRVPRGKILVGVPNAIGMRLEGVDD